MLGITIADDSKTAFTVSPATCEEHDGKYLRSLCYVFGHADVSAEIIDDADGSGHELIKILKKRAADATDEDHALVTATHAELVRKGVSGDLTLSSLKNFLTAFKMSKINQIPGSVGSDSAEVQMIHLIAYKDPEVRNHYRTRNAQKPPKTLTDAVKNLQAVLTEAQRFEELDQVTSGAPATALAASSRRAVPTAG